LIIDGFANPLIAIKNATLSKAFRVLENNGKSKTQIHNYITGKNRITQSAEKLE
jgi:hypothetical protein